MKSIVLFFRGIKASIKQNPVIYTVFLLFYTFSTIVSIYIIGKYSSYIWGVNDYTDSLSTFTADYGWSSDVSLSQVTNAINSLSSKDIGYIEVRVLDSLDVNAVIDRFTTPHYAIAYAYGEREMVKAYLKKSGIKDIDAENFIDFDDCAIIVEDAFTSSDESFFDIQEVPYKVLKRLAWGDDGTLFHLISFKSMVKNDPIVCKISVNYNNISGYNQMNAIKNSFSAAFPGAEIIEPVQRNYNTESILSTENILVYLVIVLSAVNFIYIFKYILESRRRQYEIFSLCGASGVKIAVFEVAEILLVSVVMTAFGVLVFQFAVKPLIVTLEPLLKYTFHAGMYLNVFGITVAFSFLVLVIELWVLKKRRGRA